MLLVILWGVWEIIKWIGILILGKNVVVVGRLKNVGMFIVMLLYIDGVYECFGGDVIVIIFYWYIFKE